tara:strand:- start:99 stop:449 length:351 start_codon:yes stop_codon:yes gene_type:complete
MSDDIKKKVEAASLLPDRYYLIMNYEDEDSFSMTAYDTTKNDFNIENVPAGMVMLSGMIELMENDFDRVWDAGIARLSFIAMAESFKPESKNGKEAIDKIVAREDNIVKVNFGETQ